MAKPKARKKNDTTANLGFEAKLWQTSGRPHPGSTRTRGAACKAASYFHVPD
jgi:hypothetical protein